MVCNTSLCSRRRLFHPSVELFGSVGYRAVSVDDVVYSLSRLLDDKVASPGAWVLSSVNRIYSLNDSTVSIDLTSPNPAFLGMLSMQYCSIIPIESDTVTNFLRLYWYGSLSFSAIKTM